MLSCSSKMCLLWFLTQKYKLKAIHNWKLASNKKLSLVIPHAKIQIESNSQLLIIKYFIMNTCDSSRKNTNWKQFTTSLLMLAVQKFLWFLTQKYKLKAIHNWVWSYTSLWSLVIPHAKIQIESNSQRDYST